jgi:hypothetical protein
MLKAMIKCCVTFIILIGLFHPTHAQSPFALGYQWQTYNPNYYPFKNENQYARYSLDNIRGFVLEEPGILFGAISAVYGTEANRIEARNKAIRDRENVFSYTYAEPPEMPSYRWWRWSYVSGSTQGVEYITPTQIFDRIEVQPDGTNRVIFRDSSIVRNDSLANVSYYRLDFNIVMAPQLLTDWGLYWMPSAALYVSETKLNPSYVFSNVYNDWHESKYNLGPLSTNLLFHLGYQPDFFPWLMVEGNAGLDFVQWGLAALTDAENYKPSYRYGFKGILGTRWLQFYYNWDFLAESIWGKRTRKFEGAPIEGWSQARGVMTSFGFRFDVGMLLFDVLD